ncbi:MAG: carbohydrate ABC transporter permease [Anaerolineae bacterium]|nr:carbohydrate ABC transporter permease [Anaerolineae bacterium]
MATGRSKWAYVFSASSEDREAYLTRMVLRVLLYALLIALSLLALAPFFFAFSGSLMAQGEIFSLTPHFIPQQLQWQNYVQLFERLPFLTYLKNSAVVSISNTLGVVFFSSLIGYVFAKRRFPGRDALFVLVLVTSTLPGGVTIIIPWYLLMVKLGWVNTFLPLIIPWLAPALNIFLMRQYIRSGVPDELLDAATIDGCGMFGLYWRIVLPLVKPGLVVIGILQFITVWNDFLFSLLILQKDQVRTATVALTLLATRNEQATQYGPLFAGIVLATLPTVLLFFFFQRVLTQGILSGALRG